MLEELAEDMLHVLGGIRELSERHAELRAVIDESLNRFHATQHQQALELSTLRRDLLGDRRAQANRAAFDAIHPAIDHICLVHDALGDAVGEAKTQLSVVLSSLRTVLQGLGVTEFLVAVGDPFDPACMECVEYAKGAPGVALGIVRPGYRMNGIVVRPCGVRIADPALAEREAKRPGPEVGGEYR